jgi:membrane protease YdiL (CAAX protease family)
MTKKGWFRVLLLIIPYFIIVGGFQFLGAYIAGVDITSMDPNNSNSTQRLIASFMDVTGTFLLLALFMKYIDKEPFINLGLQTNNRLREFVYGIGIGFIIMSCGFLLLLVLDEIVFQNVVIDFKEIIISTLLFMLIATVEEVLLRGYILRNLMNSFNKYIALIISSILFSLMHFFNPNIDWFTLTTIFMAGILLGLSYVYTKNLWFPIALHLSWNLFQSFFGFKVSGIASYSIIKFSIPNNNLLNGGDFGFEGSILSVIAMGIVIICIWKYYTNNTGVLKNEME